MDLAFHHENESESDGSAFESPLRWDEPIYIPPAAQSQPLSAFRLSCGALYFLNQHDFWAAGDLHFRIYREFRLLEGCEMKYLSEIHGLVAHLHFLYRLSPSAVRQLLTHLPNRIAVKRIAVGPQPADIPLPHPADGPPAFPPVFPPDTFVVPPGMSHMDIYSAPLSVRLRHVLFHCGIRCLGELDGLPCQELLLRRNCGRKTVAELHEALKRAARGEQTGRPWVFSVPQPVRALAVADLPFSARARHVLQDLEVICLGELQGRPCEHAFYKNCGRKTLVELWRMIQRAAGGEFAPPDAAQWQPEAMIPLLDALVDQLPERKRLAVSYRFGAEDGIKASLASVARRIGFKNSERVRQIMSSLGSLSALPLKAHLELLKQRCQRTTLSPALLGQWLGAAPRRYSLPFYVRLVAVLDGDINVEKRLDLIGSNAHQSATMVNNGW